MKDCAVKEMTEIQKAWLAGFFDGEGCISSSMAGRNRKHPSHLLSLANTNYDSILYCMKITGAGHINKKPEPTSMKHKTAMGMESKCSA